MIALLAMRLARVAYFRVLSLCDRYVSLGHRVAIMVVRLLPPNESLSSFVNALSRYGGRWLTGFDEASASMTSPNVKRLLLIACASLSLSPDAPVSLTRSLPARSTSFIARHRDLARIGGVSLLASSRAT